eukprot:PhF_6_TR9757/c0_g1_i1/m.15035/K15272/SLC35A1_2_3; solute carrier family 35 (UDP-sugar transporter), member A1/2/3
MRFRSLFILVILTTVCVIYTRHVQTNSNMDIALIVFTVETVKFVASLALIIICKETPPTDVYTFFDWRTALPALLYTIQNYLMYVALTNLEATTFQVGFQLKVPSTAILSVMLLKKKLCWKKWLAVVVLTFGVIMTSMGPSKNKQGVNKEEHSTHVLGMMSVVGGSLCCAFASVYFEYVLKHHSSSGTYGIWYRNAQLSFFSLLCAFTSVSWASGPNNGLSMPAWILVGLQALRGIVVALVIQHADNIDKCYATALSIVLCAFVSITWFQFVPSAQFVCGALAVIFATFLYTYEPPSPVIVNTSPQA